MRTTLSIFFLFTALSLQAQWISINESGNPENPSAALDISSNSKGVLIPRMNSTQRLAIPSPKQGLLVFQNNGVAGFYFYDGAAWDTLGGANSVSNISNVTNIDNSGVAVLMDKKAANQDGGTFLSGLWFKRDLNSLAGDLTFISLDSSTSEFTLDSGTYVIRAKAPALSVDQHQIRLFNSTNNAVVRLGSMEITGNTATVTTSFLSTVVSVGASPETFILQHQSDASNLFDGFGVGSPWGESVFSQVVIKKL